MTDHADVIRERVELCRGQIEESPYSHTVAAGWYAEDVPALVAERDALRKRNLSLEGDIDVCLQTGKVLTEQRDAADARVKELEAERDALRVKCVFPECVGADNKPEWCGNCGDVLRAEAADARVKELEAALEEERATLRWYFACNGYPAWFGESERARLRSALGGGS